MDIWLYYDITHGLHTYCNPTSKEGVLELESVLELSSESRVLDIACGMGEMLIGFNERHGATGVGVDVSRYAFRRAEKRKAARVPDAEIEFRNMPGEDYRPAEGEKFDVAMCIGASWIWSVFSGTLDALMRFVKPGGLVVSGEPYWMVTPPPPGYLEAEGIGAEDFHTLDGCLEIAEGKGLHAVWMRGSSKEEWDRYEALQLASLDRFEREQPDHPDLPEIRAKLMPGKRAYYRWGRDVCGWAIWVFRTPGN